MNLQSGHILSIKSCSRRSIFIYFFKNINTTLLRQRLAHYSRTSTSSMSHGLRSVLSDKKAFLRFVNKSNKEVELVWIDFNGRNKTYRILGINQFCDVNTYKTHPWLALDRLTKDNLYIEGQYHYHPQTSVEYFRKRYPGREIPDSFETRIKALITLPVYSLKNLALKAVRKMLNHPSDAEELELPRNLIEELRRSFVEVVDTPG